MSDGQNGLGHERCGARTRSGERCGLPAGWGTPFPGTGVCRLHGGSTPTHLARARRVAAEQAVQLYGLPVVTSPERALLDEVNRTNGHIQWLRGQIAGLDPAELASDEGVSVWLTLYQAERRHLTDVAKAAITCAAQAALADSAKHLGARMADVLERAVAGLGWEQRDEVMARFAAELGGLGTAGEPGP